MFDSLEDQLLEREMLKLLKDLQTKPSEDKQSQQAKQKQDEKQVKSLDSEKEKQINVQQKKETTNKISTAVGDEMIDWGENYVSLMRECGYDLPGEGDEDNSIENDYDDNQENNKFMVKKCQEDHNKDLAQYNEIQHHEMDSDDEETQKSKQMMRDLFDEEEDVMTPQQKKEYFQNLRNKYINQSDKNVENPADKVAYSTNSSESTIQQTPITKKTIGEDQLRNNEDENQDKENRNDANKPRSLLPQNHFKLTREMYDEIKRQEKEQQKKIQSQIGNKFGEVLNQNEDGYDSDDEQPENEDEVQNNNQQIIEEEEEEFDENIDETTQDEQIEVITELKKEYLRTNKWNCKEYKVTYSNQDVYEGEIDDKTSLKDGWGAYFYSNGEKYEGLFQDDIIHGYGRYWFLGGHKYEGDWYKGMKHGIGQLDFFSGDKYMGDFENDNFHGKGEYFYKNGDKFDGKFVNGKKNGPGKFLGSNGRKIIGEWIDDQLQHF